MAKDFLDIYNKDRDRIRRLEQRRLTAGAEGGGPITSERGWSIGGSIASLYVPALTVHVGTLGAAGEIKRLIGWSGKLRTGTATVHLLQNEFDVGTIDVSNVTVQSALGPTTLGNMEEFRITFSSVVGASDLSIDLIFLHQPS